MLVRLQDCADLRLDLHRDDWLHFACKELSGCWKASFKSTSIASIPLLTPSISLDSLVFTRSVLLEVRFRCRNYRAYRVISKYTGFPSIQIILYSLGLSRLDLGLWALGPTV